MELSNYLIAVRLFADGTDCRIGSKKSEKSNAALSEDNCFRQIALLHKDTLLRCGHTGFSDAIRRFDLFSDLH
jgi:hypothetical protein